MLNLPRGPLPPFAASHRHEDARPDGYALGGEGRRDRDARAGREDNGLWWTSRRQPGEDRGVIHARGRADLSTCHRLAHATWKRNVRPPSSSTSCSASSGQMVTSQPSHSLCPVPWPPRVLSGLTLGRMPYQSLSLIRCAAGSIRVVLSTRRARRATLPLPTLEAAQLLPKVPLHLAHLVARGVGEQPPRFYLGQLHLITARDFDGTGRVLEDSGKLGR